MVEPLEFNTASFVIKAPMCILISGKRRYGKTVLQERIIAELKDTTNNIIHLTDLKSCQNLETLLQIDLFSGCTTYAPRLLVLSDEMLDASIVSNEMDLMKSILLCVKKYNVSLIAQTQMDVGAHRMQYIKPYFDLIFTRPFAVEHKDRYVWCAEYCFDANLYKWDITRNKKLD